MSCNKNSYTVFLIFFQKSVTTRQDHSRLLQLDQPKEALPGKIDRQGVCPVNNARPTLHCSVERCSKHW